MATTILVTGATGKTARRLIPKLVQRGITVRAGSRTRAPARAGAEPVHFDWFDESTYPAALAGAEAVYLVSPQSAGDGADPSAQLQKFANSAADLGVDRVVRPGSDHAHRGRHSHFGCRRQARAIRRPGPGGNPPHPD